MPSKMAEDNKKSAAGSESYEQLAQEIEALDTYWGPTFRSIIENGKHEQFLDHLDGRIRSHDRDIEKLCNAHYQGFIDSIRELLHVRSEAQDLKSLIASMDKDLQLELENVLKRGEEVERTRRVEANIVSTIEQLQVCLPVCKMYQKLQDQLAKKRYYPALKSLEQLEHTYLPQVSRYRFTNHFRESIPKFRKQIQDSSMSELKDFLESIRKHSSRIGEIAMKHTSEQLNVDDTTLSKITADILSTNPFLDDEQDDELDEGLSAQDIVDFSPLYRCLHIFTVLGDRQTFENYYRKQRKEQSTLVLQSVPNMHESLKGYREYFHAVVGFFVIENHLLYTTNGLVTTAILEDLWNSSVPKIANALKTHASYCTDASLMLKIKTTIMLFSNTLSNYGYNTTQLLATLLDIREHYTDILMQRCVHSFREIFDEDNYHPLQVSDMTEYVAVLEVFPYRDLTLEKSSFPKRFPFSSMVPKVYEQVKEFVRASLKYTDGLNLSQTEEDDLVRKSTNVLLTRTLSGCLTTLIQKPSVGLLQLIQITINTNYLELTNKYLEEFISKMSGSTAKDVSHRAELQGKSMFKDARAEAEEQIYEKLKAKIDDTFELSNYDWTLNEPQGRASDYIIDLIEFLQCTFRAFTNLPIKVARTACMAACQHINKRLLHMILEDEDVKQISLGALKQLELDLIQCEQFASSEPVKGLDPSLLLECFTDIRQLLDLFNQCDFSTYFHDFGERASKYFRVTPQSAIKLLEKIRESDNNKKKILSVLKKDERDKKKLHETILKTLKELPQTTQ